MVSLEHFSSSECLTDASSCNQRCQVKVWARADFPGPAIALFKLGSTKFRKKLVLYKFGPPRLGPNNSIYLFIFKVRATFSQALAPARPLQITIWLEIRANLTF
eukprot:492242-Pelagomonas_calceolata.AAC.4